MNDQLHAEFALFAALQKKGIRGKHANTCDFTGVFLYNVPANMIADYLDIGLPDGSYDIMTAYDRGIWHITIWKASTHDLVFSMRR